MRCICEGLNLGIGICVIVSFLLCQADRCVLRKAFATGLFSRAAITSTGISAIGQMP